MYWDTDYYSSRNISPIKTSMPILTSKVRVLHASPGAPAVDVYVNGNIIAYNLVFSKAIEYLDISPGDYDIEIYPTETKEAAIFKKTIEIPPNGVYTVAAINKPANIDLQIIRDASGSFNSNISFLRFIHLSPNAPLLNLALNNNEIFKMIEYRETTGYYPLSPGIYSFNITPTNAEIIELKIPDINLNPNKFYTIYSIGLIGEIPKLETIILEDGLHP